MTDSLGPKRVRSTSPSSGKGRRFQVMRIFLVTFVVERCISCAFGYVPQCIGKRGKMTACQSSMRSHFAASTGRKAYKAGEFTSSSSLLMSSRRTRMKTQIQMGFNLPPGGGGNNRNTFGNILPTIVTVFGLTLFFASPLGGIFFAVTNSLFLLALITPVVAFLGFQLWAKLNTIEAACPNCGAPVVVLKSGGDAMEATPCFNCGSMVRATKDGDGVELCNAPPDFGDLGNEGGADIFDLFGSNFGQGSSTPSTAKSEDQGSSANARWKKAQRESTIIDVDVSKDD